MLQAEAEADRPSAALDAVARLSALSEAVQALCPAAEADPIGSAPTARERERRQLLQRAAEHVQRLPRGPDRGGPGAWLLWAARLQRRTARTLAQLGAEADAEIRAGLERALQHWDQAGSLSLLSPAARQAALRLHEQAGAAAQAVLAAPARGPGLLAVLLGAAEAVLAVDAACTLLRAVEARFVPLLRERLRRHDPEKTNERGALLPGGEPFLDVGGAVLAVARAFGWDGQAGEDGQEGDDEA